MLNWLNIPWQKDSFDDLENLESDLASVFKPVEPRPEFVRDLRHRLVNFPIPASPDSGSKIPQYMTLTIASLLSGVALIGFIVWVILEILGRLQPHEEHVVSMTHTAVT